MGAWKTELSTPIQRSTRSQALDQMIDRGANSGRGLSGFLMNDVDRHRRRAEHQFQIAGLALGRDHGGLHAGDTATRRRGDRNFGAVDAQPRLDRKRPGVAPSNTHSPCV